MKLENLDSVKALVKQLTVCEASLVDIRKYVETDNITKKDKKFYCHLSRHQDGSGDIASLSGCGIGLDVVQAVENVLINRIGEIKEEITLLGVEVDQNV